MKRKLWILFISFCIQQIAVYHADPVAPVYVPSAPRAEALTAPEEIDGEVALPTVTVRGFLNFRTTVDGTVIVFTPASEAPQDPTPSSSASPVVSSSPARLSTPASEDAVPQDNIQHLSFTKQPDAEKREKNKADLENEANTGDDRRQAFRHLKPGFGNSNDLQSTSRSTDVKPSHGPTPVLPQYPTGLVTVLGGTHVEGGATTVFETKVIGTYIEGKYAQILQSTSQIIFSAPARDTPKPSPKASPTVPIYTTPTVSVSSSKHSTSTSTTSFTTGRFRPTTASTVKEAKPTVPSRRADRRRDDPFSANAVLQSSFKLPDGTPERPTRPTQSLGKSYTQPSFTLSRRFRPTTTTDVPEDENTVPEFQNNRRLPPRFRYVLPRRNTPTVRLNRFKVKLTMRNEGGSTPQDGGFDNEDDLLDDYDPLTPIDPAQVVYEKTTITSEVTLHVGRRKSVRTLTITTSVPKTRHGGSYGSDVINDAYDNALYATSLPEGDVPHVVVTRTYTTTERMLKTSLVPILEGNETSYHTVTESFFILKLITGYKTLPPGEMTLLSNESDNEFLSTEALDPGLLEGAIQLEPSPHQKILQTAVPNGLLQAGSTRKQAVVPLDHSGSVPLDLSNPLISLGVALQRNPLAAVYLGLQQLNQQVTQYSTKTKTSTYVATDTIYSTKVVSFYDGRRTRTRTLSESISTIEKTMTTYTTTVEPYLNTQLFQQQHQLQQLIGNQLTGGSAAPLQLAPPPPQFSTLTSTYTTVTTATSLSTRIYTLIYNAISTKFRTVTSTTLYETTITTTKTSEVPIAITAPPGGVFPFLG